MRAQIVNIERLKSSFYGNPRFELELDNGQFVRTAPNCSLAYKICNSWEGKTISYESKPYYGNETFKNLELT